MLGRLLARLKPRPTEARIRLVRAGSLRELDTLKPPAYVRFFTKAAGELERRRPSALVVCPRGHRFALSPTHAIEADGRVRQPVGCPFADCGWLELVRLEGWPS